MNRCVLCGAETSGALNLCPHHHGPETGWAATNRIMCDFLHRGTPPPRLAVPERDLDLRGCLQEAA